MWKWSALTGRSFLTVCYCCAALRSSFNKRCDCRSTEMLHVTLRSLSSTQHQILVAVPFLMRTHLLVPNLPDSSPTIYRSPIRPPPRSPLLLSKAPRLTPTLAVLQPRHLFQLSPQVLEVQVLVMLHIDCLH